jgi:carboxymethylenebutenolidase
VQRKIELQAADGHRLAAWRADPATPSLGGIVVLHAVYGLTDHIGAVCDRWASAGYTAIAPALYDRVSRDLVHTYDKAADGSKTYASLTEAQIFADIQAAATSAGGKIVISGFCSGGSWAWRAAAALDFAAQVNFYGSHIPALIDLVPRCPTILHYGDADHVVSLPEIREIQARHPDVDLHVYPGARHAFINDQQATYDGKACELAWDRSIDFVRRQVD